MLPDSAMQRYSRQVLLAGFGLDGQRRLLRSGVLVVGAGGLGCSALAYLAGAGVGRIGIIDPDRVSLENLHRQVLFDMHDIGAPKASAAARRLRAMNPDIEVLEYPFALTNRGCLELLPSYDLVLDCTDNFPTRFMVNDACVLIGKPLVSAAVSRFEGQLSVFNLAVAEGGRPVHYRDLLPEAPPEGSVANCSEEGILGVLPGMLGSMQAAEAIKILTGVGEPLAGRLLNYSMMDNRFFEVVVSISQKEFRDMPSDTAGFLKKDYGTTCRAPEMDREIDVAELERWVGMADTLLVDIREEGELPALTDVDHLRIPLSILDREWDRLRADRIVLLCQSGSRSLTALRRLTETDARHAEAYSLRGGVSAWLGRKKQSHV